MGADALRGNGITRKILYLLRDRALTPSREPLRRVRTSRILLFVGVQLVGFAAAFAVTQTTGMHSPLGFSRPRSRPGAWLNHLCAPSTVALYSCHRVPCDHHGYASASRVPCSSPSIHTCRARGSGRPCRICFCESAPLFSLLPPSGFSCHCRWGRIGTGGGFLLDSGSKGELFADLA